jgi:hypothetical protein
MAVWTIKSGSNSGTQLVGCKIAETQGGGITTYQFIPLGTHGGGPTTTTNPPSFTGVSFNGRTDWSISSSISPPLSPPNGSAWSGSCSNGASRLEEEPGTWAAESGGSGAEEC